ncbi:archaetidylserine decarboxylase [Candidatus Methylospira mobilis]|nr:archaetidylserine decarboxylase [Candidatus Methylospira mobilis]
MACACMERLTSAIQYLLPHHLLSRGMHALARCQNTALKNALISRVVKLYGVNVGEALEPDPLAYPSFNAFFTRALKLGARPLDPTPGAILCPADGAVSQLGDINDGTIFQAKGHSYSVTELLGGDAGLAQPFLDGKFATIYLSPRDYHRLHMPLSGRLRDMQHVPGRLFSVNAATARNVPRLFARNERVAAFFDTEAGPMALVLVGAIFVSSIETVWHGEVTPPSSSTVRRWHYDDGVRLEQGAEIGRFNMGSTIIVLLGKQAGNWLEGLGAGDSVRMGQLLGTC